MSIENLAQYFSTIEDPRCSGKVEHRLTEVLVIAVCAVIACAESWDDIALYGRGKLAWLRTFLGLGQRCVDGKPNEITAVPQLLDQLALQNSIVTLDAMGCQTAIAERILARGGDDLSTLKGDHPLAHSAVVGHFDQQCFRVGAPHRADCDAFDDMQGRLVRRRMLLTASTDAAALDALSGWPGLRTVLAVESIRSVNTRRSASGARRQTRSGRTSMPAPRCPRLRQSAPPLPRR